MDLDTSLPKILKAYFIHKAKAKYIEYQKLAYKQGLSYELIIRKVSYLITQHINEINKLILRESSILIIDNLSAKTLKTKRSFKKDDINSLRRKSLMSHQMEDDEEGNAY